MPIEKSQYNAKKREHIDSLKNNISFVCHDKGGNK